MTLMPRERQERLYHLLPAFYRHRDHAQGEPLRALLSIVQQEVDLLEADIESLYENWFIETAAEWLIPYIGDLLGVSNLHTVDSAGFSSLRAYVANTLAYRQRKGTAAVLEQLADDITGWEARVVEFFQLLATTQHLNHLRPQNLRTPDLRNVNALELLDSPFDTIAHTAEVRRIATRQGRYNIPNIGLFLWRLQAYPLQLVTPRAVSTSSDERCYWFNPLGIDAPIFNRPQAELGIAHIATERNVPTPIRRRALAAEREAYLGGVAPPLEVYLDGVNALAPKDICVCNLDDWDAVGWTLPVAAHGEQVAVDPALGRLVILDPLDPAVNLADLRVSTTYGFSGDVGGGPYDRNEGLDRDLTTRDWVRQVGKGDAVDYSTLRDAVAAWNAPPAKTRGVISIVDNSTYEEELTGDTYAVKIPAGSDLLIVAARPFDADDAQRLDATGRRPHLLGNLSIVGTAADRDENPGSITIDGLLIEGTVRALRGNLGALKLRHCTIVPGKGGLLAQSQENERLHITLERSICGTIQLGRNVPRLTIAESIIDGVVDDVAGPDIFASGASVTIERSTVLGADDVPIKPPALRELQASESIFTGRLIVERRQAGCVRFCYLPADSRVPRRYRCQPDLAMDGIRDPAERAAIEIRLRPQFTSQEYGHPGYGQLSRRCHEAIRTGSADGSEMGAFSYLKQPQREANLRVALDEYLPFGLQAGISHVT